MLGSGKLLMATSGLSEDPGSGADPHFASVISLLHMNGADGSSTINDVIGNSWTVRGTPNIKTDQYKFGGSSWRAGTNGSIITSDIPAIRDDDFTFEWWIYPLGSADMYGRYIQVGTQSPGGIVINNDGYDSPPTLLSQVNSYNTNVAATHPTASIPLNTWSHIALTRQENTYRTFFSGVKVDERTTSKGHDLTQNTVSINGNNDLIRSGENYNAYYDEIRITKGVARYISNFSPPTGPFPDN